MIRFTLKYSIGNGPELAQENSLGIIHVEMKFDAGLRLRRSLQMKVKLNDWITERQRVKPQAQGSMEVNMVLNQIEAKFQELNHRLRYTGEHLNIHLVEDEILHAFKNGGYEVGKSKKSHWSFLRSI